MDVITDTPEKEKPDTNVLENLVIEPEPPEPEAKPSDSVNKKDMAFLRSGWMSITLNGKDIKLEAYEYGRQVASQLLGMRFYDQHGEAVEELLERGSYNGMFRDGILFTYLCLQPDSYIRKIHRRVSAVEREIQELGQKNKVSVGTDNFNEATGAFSMFINDFME